MIDQPASLGNGQHTSSGKGKHTSADQAEEQARHAAPKLCPWPADQQGDSSEDVPQPESPFALLDSARFAAAEYRREWLVRRILVRDQPAVLGGPKKALKTSFLVDLALSLGTGAPFLGSFAIPQAV